MDALVAAMEQRLFALERQVAALEDREAIRSLIATYGPLADCGAADAIAALWTADGTYEVVGFATARGRTEIAALIEGPTHRALMAGGCAHLLGPLAIDIDGDCATARGHSVVFRHMGDGRDTGEIRAFEPYRVSANRWALVREREGGTAGQWRVSHRANALLDGNEAARTLLAPPGL